MIQIDIINQSTVSQVSDGLCKYVVNALQVQVSRDVYPVWGVNAQLHFIPRGGTPDPNHWHLVLLDNSDQAGALGYHDFTANGLPLGKAFVGDDIKDGVSWTVTISHELLEMLIDPYIDATVFNQSGTATGVLYAYEICDACEADNFGYIIMVPTNTTPAWFHILVSDFVFPGWFIPGTTGKVDFMGVLGGALQLGAGGYIGAFQVPNDGSGWSQITAEGKPSAQLAKAGHRTARRTIPYHQRKRSTR